MINFEIPVDRIFHALADPTRRGMIERLARGPASVGDLAKPLAMSLPAVMQHLKLLEGNGLVRSEKIGRVRTCRLEETVLRTIEDWVSERRLTWERHFDRLGDYLAEQEANEKGSK